MGFSFVAVVLCCLKTKYGVGSMEYNCKRYFEKAYNNSTNPIMHKILDQQDLRDYYRFVNKTQRKLTQIDQIPQNKNILPRQLSSNHIEQNYSTQLRLNAQKRLTQGNPTQVRLNAQKRLTQTCNVPQKNATQIRQLPQKIDLFVVLDISGSMQQTCNKILNNGAGFLRKGGGVGATAAACLIGGPLSLIGLLGGGLISIGGSMAIEKIKTKSDTRLDQAKKHLSFQIQDLIKTGRINKLGLIIFNSSAKVVHGLTDDFGSVLEAIRKQYARGSTALYDAIKFASEQLKNSKNPRMLIMTDGQDNSSKEKINWMQEFFLKKEGLKSTFFTICQGDTQGNKQLAQHLQAKYIKLGEECWFSNKFDDKQMVEGMEHLKT